MTTSILLILCSLVFVVFMYIMYVSNKKIEAMDSELETLLAENYTEELYRENLQEIYKKYNIKVD